MIGRDEVLQIIRRNGPVLPVQISKEGGISILFASAMLSELVSAKLLKVSSVKIGGSPVYYAPEQSSRLQEFSKYLPQKEKEAYELLKSRQVLRESEQAPAIKVALRSIKDYSWPLKVTVGSNPEIFWKWYLSTNEEAEAAIKAMLGIGAEEPPKRTEEKPDDELKIPEENGAAAEAKETQHLLDKPQKEDKREEPKAKAVEAEKPVEQKKNEQSIKTETVLAREESLEGFPGQVVAFFSQNNIKVLGRTLIRKNEADFIIEIKSAVGNLKYYCKSKEKKRIGDSDLSSAYVQGELRKLPVLFLSSGEPSKRAKEMLGREFQNMVFKQIGGVL